MSENIRKNVLIQKTKSLFFFFIKIAIAGSIIFWLIYNNYNAFVSVIHNIDIFWLIGGTLLYLVVMLASAWRWFLLLKLLNINITYFEAISLSMQGGFFSLVIPGGSLGGDLVKTGFLLTRMPKGKRLEATSTIFMDRFLGMFGQFSIGVIMGVVCISLIERMDDVARLTAYVLILLSLAGIIAGIMILFHRKLEKIRFYCWGVNIVDRYTKGYVSRIFEILDVYRNAGKTLVQCILIGAFFIQINMAFILYFIAHGIHSKYIAIKPFILAISLGNTAGLLPITPSGIGTRDVVIKSILTAGGFFEGDAVAIPLFFSALILLFSIFGGLFFIFSKNRNKKQNKLL